MRYILALALLIASSLAGQCDIPLLWTIKAEDRCAAFERFQIALQWSRDRQWYATWFTFRESFELYELPALLSLEETPEEYLERWPDGSYTVGSICIDGFCLWPSIRWARDSIAHPLPAELDHLLAYLRCESLYGSSRCRTRGSPERAEWTNVGHANKHDRFLRVLQYRDWWFYGVEDSRRVAQPAHQQCKILED